MIYRIFPDKDTFLTNAQRNSTQQTGSNFGASEIFHVFKKAGVSGSTGVASSASIARSLVQFDLSALAALTASGKAPSTGSQYYLRLTNAVHSDTVPTSYDMLIVPVSRSWDEGSGIDVDTYLDKGFANWDKAKQGTFWTTPGGDFLATPSVTVHFDNGVENVEADVTSIVNAWLTGGLPNNGLMLKLTSAEETDTSDYFIKKFHSGDSHYLDNRPTLEMRFDDSVKDDRANFVWGATNKLYLYNKVKGTLQDVPGIVGPNSLLVRLQDVSGSVITSVSGSHTGRAGIYSASLTLATGSYTGSIFYDVWLSASVPIMTGTLYPRRDGAFQSNTQEQYIATVKNLKREYENDEIVRLNVFFRTRTYNPAVVRTGSLHMANTVITKGYYRVDNATTNKPVIPLGTGSPETTRLSYDGGGNYFEFYTSTLSKREVYKLVFFADVDGQLQRIDENVRFRIV